MRRAPDPVDQRPAEGWAAFREHVDRDADRVGGPVVEAEVPVPELVGDRDVPH
jgi:hypothetical protein